MVNSTPVEGVLIPMQITEEAGVGQGGCDIQG